MRRLTALALAGLGLLAGCGGSAKLSYPVELAYRGPEQRRAIPLGVKPPRLVVAPFVDARPEPQKIGEYRTTFGQPVELRVAAGDLGGRLTQMVSDLFRKAGYDVRPGRWDGEPESLARIDADYALWGRVDAFRAVGAGTIYDTRREARIRLTLKMGGKGRGVVSSRVVEVTPNDRDVHLFGWGFDHYEAMAKFVNDALSLALERGAIELAGRVAKP